MYRIHVGLCILSSLALAIAGVRYCPSVMTYLIIVAPQLAILAAFARISWILRQSCFANGVLSVPEILVLGLAWSTARYSRCQLD